MDKSAAIAKATPHAMRSDLESMLTAWHTATLQLEQTHEALREQIRRLTTEAEAPRGQPTHDGRLANLRRLASRIAAEVRDHLASVSLNLSLLRRRITDDPIGSDLLGKIEAHLVVVDASVRGFLYLASDRNPRLCAFSLTKLIDEILESLARRIDAQSIDTVVDVPGSQTLWADRDMIRQALVNLMLNAVDTMPEGGTLTITSAWTDRGLELEVADTGPGLSEATRDRMFEPFFRSKSVGTGLGLALVHHMIEAHGGHITAVNCPDGGAAFTLCIPQQVMKAVA
ncbi:MAG: HAMP domain-containing histidine kinase [Pirellulales bacterium]|nr:HAMP domain-containing histidine kinase [Pirellulales bacterium]